MPLLKDAFIEHMILSELPHLAEDLKGRKNSRAAKRYIAGKLKRMGPKDRELESVSIKVGVATVAWLKELQEEHNLCRDAFMNFLIAFVRGSNGFLNGLGFATSVDKLHLRDGNTTLIVEDMPTSPLRAISVSLTDPLYYLRSECSVVHGCGLYAMELPRSHHGIACYLPDRVVPGTPEFLEAQAMDILLFNDLGGAEPTNRVLEKGAKGSRGAR